MRRASQGHTPTRLVLGVMLRLQRGIGCNDERSDRVRWMEAEVALWSRVLMPNAIIACTPVSHTGFNQHTSLVHIEFDESG